MKEINKKDIVYYARTIPEVGIYEICELKIRTVEDTYFVGVDKRDKHAFLFNMCDIGKIIFLNRKEALEIVRNAENKKIEVPKETFYEEY